MVLALEMALGVLVASFVAVIGRAAWILASEYAKDNADYREFCRQRDAGRCRKAVDRILAEDWRGSPADERDFREVWRRLASCLEIDEELLRPDDRVSDVIVSSERFGPDSYDVVDFFDDLVPGEDPFTLLEQVARDEQETVADIVEAVLSRRAEGTGRGRRSGRPVTRA